MSICNLRAARAAMVFCAPLALLLAGCASGLPTEPPAPWMMAKPKPLTDVKAGDDIVQKYAELRRDAGKDKSRVRGLQAYVKTLLSK